MPAFLVSIAHLGHRPSLSARRRENNLSPRATAAPPPPYALRRPCGDKAFEEWLLRHGARFPKLTLHKYDDEVRLSLPASRACLQAVRGLGCVFGLTRPGASSYELLWPIFAPLFAGLMLAACCLDPPLAPSLAPFLMRPSPSPPQSCQRCRTLSPLYRLISSSAPGPRGARDGGHRP